MTRSIASSLALLSLLGASSVAACVAGAGGAGEPSATTRNALSQDDDNSGGDGGGAPEYEPSSPPLNGLATIAVDGGPLMIDLGQEAATKLTLDGTWAPAAVGGVYPIGQLAFRASYSSLLIGYVLQIDATGHPSLLVNQPDGKNQVQSTTLAGGPNGPALVMTSGTYAFELVANGNKFTVTDTNHAGKQVLAYTDPNMDDYPFDAYDLNDWAYVNAPAMWVTSPGAGTWGIAARDQGNAANPPLGVASIVVPVAEENNTVPANGLPDILVNHFDIAQPASTEIDFMITSMLDGGISGDQGHITLHREDTTGQGESDVSDYNLHVFQNKLELHKQYNGQAETIASVPLDSILVNGNKVFPNGLEPRVPVPLQFMAYDHDGAVTVNVNLTDMGTQGDGGVLLDLTPQTNAELVFKNGEATINGATFPQDATYVHILTNIISWTDTPADPDAGTQGSDPNGWPVFLYGYRFGLYTSNGNLNCWQNVALINHPGRNQQ